MVKKSLTAVIPTYNRGPVLRRALESVFSQTVPADEVIVVDDGSTDETPRLIQENFPDARYIRQNNQGVSTARNRGIAAARSEWVAFLDSDDEWRATKLERQLDSLEELPRFRVCHTNEVWIRRGRRVNPMKKHQKYGGYIFEQCLPLCVISPSSVVIHKSVFEELGTFDEELPVCEDYDLWLRVCALNPVLYLEEPLVVKYGGHEDQLSRSLWGMDRFRIRALEKIIGSGKLSTDNLKAARDVLRRKIDIYVEGAKKRGKQREVEDYLEKRRLLVSRQSTLNYQLSCGTELRSPGETD